MSEGRCQGRWLTRPGEVRSEGRASECVPFDAPFTLGYGETRRLAPGDIQVTFKGVLAARRRFWDARSQVVEQARIGLELRTGGDPAIRATVWLPAFRPSAGAFRVASRDSPGFQITLLHLAPYPGWRGASGPPASQDSLWDWRVEDRPLWRTRDLPAADRTCRAVLRMERLNQRPRG